MALTFGCSPPRGSHNECMTHSEDSPSNTFEPERIPHNPILIGSDPGAILAAMPSMMGFVPDRSLVIIGILPDPSHPHRFRVGPVVRAEMDPESITDAVRAMARALTDIEDVKALLYAIHPRKAQAEQYVDMAEETLLDHEIGSLGSWWAPELVSGGDWEDLETEGGGSIGPLTDNPMHSHSAIHGAKIFSNRKELDTWLTPLKSVQPLYPRTFVDSAESAGETTELLKDACTVMDFVLSIYSGDALLEQECGRRKFVLAAASLARDERLHPLLVALSLGDRAPIMRELLAEAARRTRTQVRRRLLALLSTVLAGNGEGMPAFHTLQRCGSELGKPRELGNIDGLTALMRSHLWQGHMEGTSKAQAHRVAEHGVFWAVNWALPEDSPRDAQMEETFRERYREFIDKLERAVDWDAMAEAVPSGPCLPEHS